MEKSTIQRLIDAALEARERSYCPFSGFAVGAALLAEDGTIFSGCNVEISGLGSTCCAERTAIFKAVSEGCTKIAAIAIVGGKKGEPPTERCAPCGVCRQVIAEFGNLRDCQVIMGIDRERYELCSLEQILPFAFKREDC